MSVEIFRGKDFHGVWDISERVGVGEEVEYGEQKSPRTLRERVALSEKTAGYTVRVTAAGRGNAL